MKYGQLTAWKSSNLLQKDRLCLMDKLLTKLFATCMSNCHAELWQYNAKLILEELALVALTLILPITVF